MKIGIILLVCSLAGLLAGCAAPVQVVRQEIPISVPCWVPIVQAPAWPIEALKPTADLFEIVRDLWATLELHEGYEAELTAAVKACE